MTTSPSSPPAVSPWPTTSNSTPAVGACDFSEAASVLAWIAASLGRLGVAVSGGSDSVFLLHATRGVASDDGEPFLSASSLPVAGDLEQHSRRRRLRLFGGG